MSQWWRRRAMRPRTLRHQLVVLITAILLVMCATLAVVSTLALRSNLMHELDTQVQEVSQRASGPRRTDRLPATLTNTSPFSGTSGPALVPSDSPSLSSASPTTSSPSASSSPSSSLPSDAPTPGAQIPNAVNAGTIVVQIRDGEILNAGYFSATTGEYQKLTEEQISPLTALPVDGQIYSVDVPGFGQVRAMSQTGRDTWTSVTAMSTENVTSALREFLVVEITVAAVVVLVAGVIATVLVRRSLRPLDRVASAATKVSELPLSEGEVAALVGVDSADTDERTEVGKVGAALNRMLGHVETSLTARHDSEMQVRQFVADASHELRTPLASIRGYAELIERSPYDLPADTVRSLDRIHSESIRMGGLVEDLLLLARLDAGRPLAHDPVDLVELAVDAVTDAHAAARDHAWRLDVPDEGLIVTGDEARLRQIFANLLANARVHTPAGTTVTATVRVGRGDSSIAEIVVKDDGPGIAPALIPTIFQRFTRADEARNRVSGSTGLGLAIVEAIAHSHGGKVKVDSTPGATSFTVTLPRN